MGDGGFHQRLPQIFGQPRRQAGSGGCGAGVGDHLGLAGFVPYVAAAGLDTGGGVHVAETAREQRHQFLIKRINPGAHLHHCLAGFWRQHGHFCLQRPVFIHRNKGFSGATQAMPATP